MKKITLLFILLIFTVINVFAIDLSVGAGGLLGYTFTRYRLEGDDIASRQTMDRFNYGAHMFLDSKYLEFNVMIMGGRNTYSENMIYSDANLTDSKGSGTEASLGFALLGKYPFTLSDRMTWFPMFGIEYHIALVQKRQPEGDYVYDRTQGAFATDVDKDGNPYPLSAWNYFLVDVGAGLDYNLTGRIFLRTELLFGFRLPTGYELGALKVVKNPPMNIENPKLAGLTGTPGLKLSAGYRL